MIERVKNFHWIRRWFGSEESREEHVRRMAENRKPCSCYICGNPRQHHKDRLTVQEKRVLQENEDDVQL